MDSRYNKNPVKPSQQHGDLVIKTHIIAKFDVHICGIMSSIYTSYIRSRNE